ncbi:transporter substrate-binding domain-containing protein [Acidaminobacter hydrogenoformans]|uniref:histidine kinase n=1 Tax=Acidaminobacter hydrogenoformans DSM 2784 TaxID=1120920 RepID=A0A1G5S0R7_9FIRM|nr:transporter substrate-binding domain-containing protein [Acidaminobacter hydrogenoformans]SCZ79883.1 His Kinase A (phospho-acceptor) domain-containing protein [Acidaminobacter hydrogenoformans DSM 2784]
MRTIEICGDLNYPPFEYYDKDGNCKGFSIEITKSIAKAMNFEVVFNLMEWTEAIQRIKRNEFLAIQGMSISNERKEDFVFSKEYVTVFHSVYTLSNRADINVINDLYRKKIAVQENDISYDIIIKKSNINHPIHIVKVRNQKIALEMLINQEVDAIAGNRMVILYYAKDAGTASMIKSVGAPINITKFGLGFRKNRRDLLKLFNDGIQKIREDGTYQRIYDNWFGEQIDFIDNQIIETTGTGIICLDSLGVIKAINNSACSLLRINKYRTIFKSFYESELINFIDGDIIQKTLDDSSNVYHNDILFNDYFDEKKWLKINISPLLDSGNNNTGIIINLRDVTIEKKSEEALKTYDKMQSLGRLILNVAHEIRNPLTSIKNFVDLLPQNIDDPEFRTSLLKHVPNQVSIIDNILKELLTYSSPRLPHFQCVELSSFFTSLLDCQKNRKYNIEFMLYIEKNVKIYVDEKQLWQIMMNIVNNAIEAIDNEGSIYISANYIGSFVRITIEDDGIGISKDDLNNIFDPFFTKKETGTGLGLYITYQLISDNNGSIVIESNGNGTKVILNFKGCEA